MSKLKTGVTGLFLLAVLVAMARHSSADNPLCTDIETTCLVWGPANPSYPGYCCQQVFAISRTVPTPEGVTAAVLPAASDQCAYLTQVETSPLGDTVCGDKILPQVGCGGAKKSSTVCTSP